MRKLLLFIFSGIMLPGTYAQIIKADLAITGSYIIDVQSGRIIKGKTILIKGKQIWQVIDKSKTAVYAATVTVDAKEKYVIPGLWDMHVHFGGGDTLIEENKNLLPLYIAHGITTVRDAAADISPSVLQWRDEIESGELAGPSIFTSGPKLEGYRSVWQGDLEIATVEELNRALDSLHKIKADFIKITDNTIRPDIYLSSIREARKRGFKISGHVPYSLTVLEASAAGLSSIEHMGYLLKAASAKEKKIAAEIASGRLTNRDAMPLILESFDETVARSVYRRLAAHGTAVVPTLSISFITAYLDRNDHRDDKYLDYIGKGLRNTYNWRVQRAAEDSPEAIELRHRVFEKSASLLPLLKQAGVTIIAGTDAGYLNCFVYPGFGLHTELELLVKYGLTPLEALQSAIVNGPKFFGKEKLYGNIARGKMADLIILDENPLQNISATQKINAVILKGKLYTRSKLNELLDETRIKVRAGY
ncbi:MAG: amidohydrolase family protein [Chitinophagaceae bacterium]|nr:amidohydrolase family protein [Chitinophagaceae bacterium]